MTTSQPIDARTHWSVCINFADGDKHEASAFASSKHSAFRLALIDARMGHPFGSFMAPVQSWDAKEVAA